MQNSFGSGVIVQIDNHLRKTSTEIAEQYTASILKNVVSIACDSPDFIVEQVAAFKERIAQAIFDGVNQAVRMAVNKTEKQFLLER